MNARALLVPLAAITVLASGCAAGGADQARPAASSHSTGSMPGMAMAGVSSAAGPSPSARMICGSEIADAVRRTFALRGVPRSSHTWADGVFGCTYALPHGMLRMSVRDDSDPRVGRAAFERLRGSLSRPRTVHGMQSFGFPAFTTPSGNAVFLKDAKTLRVDASMLTPEALPAGLSRQDAAYAVASAVIACWSE